MKYCYALSNVLSLRQDMGTILARSILKKGAGKLCGLLCLLEDIYVLRIAECSLLFRKFLEQFLNIASSRIDWDRFSYKGHESRH